MLLSFILCYACTWGFTHVYNIVIAAIINTVIIKRMYMCIKAWANSINPCGRNRQVFFNCYKITTTISFVYVVLCLHSALGCRYYMKDEQCKQHIVTCTTPMQGSALVLIIMPVHKQ